jgi:hypothetical protein
MHTRSLAIAGGLAITSLLLASPSAHAVKAKPVAGCSSQAGWELIGPDPEGFAPVDTNGDGFLCFRQLNSGKGIIIDNNVPF